MAKTLNAAFQPVHPFIINIFPKSSHRACTSCYHAYKRKQSNSPRHYTIRGVAPEVDRALRLKAAQRSQSLNRVVLDELTRARIGRPVKADFSDLVGKWTPDPTFDETVASQRQIDAKKWK